MLSINKMMPVILLVVMFVVGLPFLAATMGSVDTGVDLEGSDYEAQYEATTDVSTSSISMLQIIPYLLTVVIIIIAIGALWVKKRSKGYY